MNKPRLKYGELNEERLKELKQQTKDKYIHLLIRDLRRILALQKGVESPKTLIYINHVYRIIVNLIEKEKSRNNLLQYKNPELLNSNFNLRVSSYKRKSQKINIPGNFALEKLSEWIQIEFDLEPGHLYEFKIGKLKFGPKCDDWQEIFDFLDNYKICHPVGSAGLSKGDYFSFVYDFGENINFRIKILDIKNGE